ncbi:DeoR family transcriptional regulator [soil metagenome]
MNDFRLDRVGSAERGENPMVIARMESGFAVIGDTQFLPGYTVLLASPQVAHLTELAHPARRAFLFDMSLIGEAIERVCAEDGLVRVNYEILGNTDAFLHAHIFPRYSWEDPERLRKPPFLYPPDRWTDPAYQYSDAAHGSLRERIRLALTEITGPSTKEL